MKKKLLMILLALSLCFSLVACAQTGTEDSSLPEESSQEEENQTDSQEEETSGEETPENTPPAYQYTPVLYGNPEGMEWKQDTSPINLSIYFAMPNSGEFNWGSDHITQTITERTGVTLEYLWDETGDNTQLQLWMAAGDPLPDYLQGISRNTTIFDNLKSGGYIYDLNELFDEYAPISKDTLLGGTEDFCSDEDGSLWMYDTNAFGLDQPTQKILALWGWNVARGDLLAEHDLALGDSLGTPDELLEMLAAVKEDHPEVKFPITVELGLAFPFYQAFGGIPSDNGTYFDADDNNVYYWWQDQEAGKDALLFINKLYREGYLNKEWFTYTDEQKTSALLAGDIFLYTHVNTYNHTTINSQLYENSGGEQWYSVVRPMAEEGVNPVYATSYLPVTGGGICISTDTADPARAIRFLSYTCSEEGQMLIFCGVEGVDYEVQLDEATGLNVPIFIGEAKEAIGTGDWGGKLGIGKWFWHGSMPAYWQYLTMYAQMLSQDTDYATPVAENAAKGCYLYGENNDTTLVESCALGVSIAPDSDAGLIQTQIDEYIQDYMLNVYLAESNDAFEAAYNELLSKIAEFDANGILAAEKSRQALERKALLEEAGIVWTNAD
ncbi:MAG: hypothetical protein E7487_11375 [Ruminococcaceae bacterium]|nr:hypothetical protein [Oscillospiraceae bacterium]